MVTKEVMLAKLKESRDKIKDIIIDHQDKEMADPGWTGVLSDIEKNIEALSGSTL